MSFENHIMYEDEPFQFVVPPIEKPVSPKLQEKTQEDIVKFTGAVAERYKLTGTETLTELVGKFKEPEGALVGNILPAVRKTIKKTIKERQGAWLRKLESIVQEPHLPSESAAIDRALWTLQAACVCAELDERYVRVSPDLFNLHYGAIIKQEGQEYTISLPLFASVPFGSAAPWQYKEEKQRNSYTTATLSVSAKSPPLTPLVKYQARKMAADVSEAYAAALKIPVLGDVLMADGQRFSKGGGLELNVYWIPKPSELRVKVEEYRRDPDPLLIGKVFGRNYLVAQWDVAGEEPYQHYLEEFTVHDEESGEAIEDIKDIPF